jgi:CRISPR-associated protein Csx14
MLSVTASTLICTLGGQAQVVTFALDFLLNRGEAIQEVIALHLASADGRVAKALSQLQTVFDQDHYRGQPCRFHHLPIRRGGQTLTAIQTEADAELTRQTVHQLITTLKQTERKLHLCIAGGPRLMGLMALSAAMLHCGHQDHIWHMYTQPDFLAQAQDGAILHDQLGTQVHLIPVPLVPWGAYFSVLRSPAKSLTELLKEQTDWLDDTERQRCQSVWKQLTLRQREVLLAFARGGSPQDVATALTIELKTVHSHKTVILDHCRAAWGLADKTRLTYHFLRERFGPFAESLP